MEPARAVVSSTSRLSNAGEDHEVETTREADLNSPRFGRGREAHVGVNGTCPTESPRTLMDTDQGAREAAESVSDEDPGETATDVGTEGGGGGGPARAEKKGFVRAWGLKDPSVARAMIKRANRMRKFQNGEARREKMKNPDARFDVFARNAGEHRAVRGAALTEAGRAVRSPQHGIKLQK